MVLGKGGVGRTTVARALALASARRRRTLLVDVGSPGRSEQLAPDLYVRTVDPLHLLDQAVGRLLPLGPLATAITRHPAYASLIQIAPALRELAFLDAVDHLARDEVDEVIVDSPASGHGLHVLQAPSRAMEVLAGHLKARAETLDATMHDAQRTRVIVVCLPAELPVMESLDLLAELEREGFAAEAVVVNRVPPEVPASADAAADPDPKGVTPMQAIALLSSARHDAEHWLGRLHAGERPCLELPLVVDRDGVEERLSTYLEELA